MAITTAQEEGLRKNLLEGAGENVGATVATPSYSNPLGTASVDIPINSKTTQSAIPTTVPTPVNSNSAYNRLGVVGAKVAQPLPKETSAPSNQPILNEVQRILEEQKGKGDFTLGIQKEEGLAEKQTLLREINNEALMTKKAYDDQIKSISSDGSLTKEQASSFINEINRKKNDDLANIGIRQAVALGNVELAEKIIKDKVDAKFEPLDNQLKTLQIYSDFFKNDLTESEKRKLDLEQDALKEKRQSISTAYQNTLSAMRANNAPQSAYQIVDEAASDPDATPGTISAAAGKYAQTAASTTITEINGRKVLIDNLGNKTDLGPADGTNLNTNNFTDVMQEAINQGATPEQAAREAAAVSEASGISVDQKTLNTWTEQARRLKAPSPVTEEPVKSDTRTASEKGSDLGQTIRFLPEAIKERGEKTRKEFEEREKKNKEFIGSFFSSLFGE